MSRTIWKFPLKMTDAQVIEMPSAPTFLAVQLQNRVPCLWVMVNPESAPTSVDIRIHGTGHELPADANQYEHLGTFQLDGGALVFHVFRLMSLTEMLGRIL